uniref:Venom protein family 2 protein 6 n=1 Tax=Platymeris rhadamanthus TaxID=1134088 RepID=A0A6B9KZ31_PLARH|nr:venom protein family 2 protein 6 [Platymeris rhadamanthus]
MADFIKVMLFLLSCIILLTVSHGEITQSDVEPNYNEAAKGVMAELKARAQSRSVFDGFGKPKCWFEDFTGACCVSMRYKSVVKGKTPLTEKVDKHKACVEIGVEFTSLKSFVRITYDGEVLGRALEYKFGQICWPLPPPLQQLSACVWIWHVDVNVSKKYAELCFLFSFAKVFHVRFDCIRWDNGQFTLHNKVLPKKDQPIFGLYMGTKGVSLDVQKHYLKKAKITLEKVWLKIKAVFGRSDEMKVWLLKPED